MACRNNGKEIVFSEPSSSTNQSMKRNDEAESSKKTGKKKAKIKDRGYRCPVWDIRVAPGRRDETKLVHEFWTSHEGGWEWLSRNLAAAYLRQTSTDVHPFGQQLTPYNCWPGRSIFYYGVWDQEIIWPEDSWPAMSFRLKKVVLRGGIRPDNR